MKAERIEFIVYGPFDIPLGIVGGTELDDKTFWRGEELARLRGLTGCYVFALRRVKGALVPHYVGLTKRRFDDEVFNPSNRRKYRCDGSQSANTTRALFDNPHNSRQRSTSLYQRGGDLPDRGRLQS
jgi:hypothetical protein